MNTQYLLQKRVESSSIIYSCIVEGAIALIQAFCKMLFQKYKIRGWQCPIVGKFKNRVEIL